MPYELSFTKRVTITDREQYINECCVGGDVIANQLLPAVRRQPEYTHLQTNQEDWGWFIWFRKGVVHLAIDIFTDDPEKGEFRIRLTSSLKRVLWSYREVDTPELEELREWVIGELKGWTGSAVVVDRV